MAVRDHLPSSEHLPQQSPEQDLPMLRLTHLGSGVAQDSSWRDLIAGY